MTYTYTTQAQLRAAFWQDMPETWTKYRNKRQNDWPCNLRMEWCDFVEMLSRDGHISDALTNSVTG